MEKGYIHLYTGNGKGKTTAALGLALRAAGGGITVYIGQFMKQGEYSEVRAIRDFLPQITLEQYGSPEGFLLGREADDGDFTCARQGLEKGISAAGSGQYGLVILDELLVAVSMGLLSLEDVLDLMDRKSPGTELVLTGRNAHPELIQRADLVSEVAEIKHYYTQGVPAREGIEL